MKNWLDTVYSDGTELFVDDQTPQLGSEVGIRIRFAEYAPVKHVLIRTVPNGSERYITMEKIRTSGGMVIYEGRVKVNEYRVPYQFHLVCEDVIYFYTQNGITTYIPDHTYDFVLLSGYVQPAWVKDAVFYQIFPERFANGNHANDVQTDEYVYRGNATIRMEDWSSAPLSWEEGRALDFFGGDLDGIREKLPYLKELGVTALYINPVFSAYSTHKYDCIDYFHVDKHFGGDEALEQLCAAVHAAGMRIVLDISINHTGICHHWVEEGRPFYFRKADGSLQGWFDVEELPVLDYRSEELRDFIYRGDGAVLRKWLRPPYSIDGWRFDVADVFARNDAVQLADELWPEICAAIREENPEAFIIGEDWGDCGRFLQGNLWNTPMNYYGFGRPVRQFLGLGDLFLERNEILGKVKYKMTAEDLEARIREHFAKIPGVIQECQLNLFDSHDIPRMHNYESISFEKFKCAVVMQLFVRGIPCIYYGDELAIDGYTYHDAGFRFPMPWEKRTEEGKKHYALYHRMIELKRTIPAFFAGGMKVILTTGRVIAIARFSGEETYIGVVSAEEERVTVSLPLWKVGVQRVVEEDLFGERISLSEGRDGELLLTIDPYEAFVFACE